MRCPEPPSARPALCAPTLRAHLGKGWARGSRSWSHRPPPPLLLTGSSFTERTIQCAAWSPAGMMAGFPGNASCPDHQLQAPDVANTDVPTWWFLPAGHPRWPLPARDPGTEVTRPRSPFAPRGKSGAQSSRLNPAALDQPEMGHQVDGCAVFFTKRAQSQVLSPATPQSLLTLISPHPVPSPPPARRPGGQAGRQRPVLVEFTSLSSTLSPSPLPWWHTNGCVSN